MMDKNVMVDLNVDLSEDDVQKMLDHINQLDEIRMDLYFRMVFLFQEVSCSHFISEFKERQPRMLQFLKELEEIAVQLDKMNKGAKISSVAGSSVGAVGGVLSIVGLALIPFTAGGSLALTIGGLGLGITSGVNSIVTTAAEAGVNATQKKKAGDVIQSFMKDMQIVQGCLEEVANQPVAKVGAKLIEIFVAFIKIGVKTYSVKRQIGLLTEAVSAAKALRNEELISSVGAEAVQEVNIARAAESVASELPEVTEAAVEGPLSLSRTVRMGSAALNALFIGVDVYFICKDSISLAKGTETEVSKFIRARAALWNAEMDSWERICESLCKGQPTSKKMKAVLESPFYPDTD
ncbi:apolipoprotein L1-like [Stegastes partitus]|nr:PREDICTED: apolipoprotein L1-like [Stegastes partitus]